MTARSPLEPWQEGPGIFERICEQAPDALIVVDGLGRIVRVNARAEAMFAVPRERLVGQPVGVLLPQAVREPHLAHQAAYMRHPRPRRMAEGEDIHAQGADGSQIPVDVMLSPLETPGGTCVIAAVRDVRESRRRERERAGAALRASEERFKAAVMGSPAPVLLYDDRDRIVAVNEAWLRQSGYLRDELATIGDWTALAHKADAQEVCGYFHKALASAGEAERAQHPVRTRGGRERLWSFVTSPLGVQSDGRRLALAAARDVAERQADEERIGRLMREARHRTKNILSLVQILARQTAVQEPDAFLENFCERIQALAANQDLLVRNEWHGADVGDLVRSQLGRFTNLVGSRIAVRGSKVRLNASAVQALGLAIHELASNAGKYGALSTASGHVDVDWRFGDGKFAISWTERGGPSVTPPRRRGFGTAVIEPLAERAVSGEVTLDYGPAGFGWRLTCPQENALDAVDA